MKTTPIVLLTFVLFISVSCSKSRWEGLAYEEDGATIVENTGSGLWPSAASEKVKFIETLSIGKEEGEDHLMFHSEVNISIDSDGNIYVLDARNHRLLKFDKDGKFIWKAGRKGQGPGEFQSPFDLDLHPQGEVCVLDRFMIHFFDAGGEFLRTLNLRESFTGFEILPDGRFLMQPWEREQPGISAVFYNSQGELLGAFPAEYRYQGLGKQRVHPDS